MAVKTHELVQDPEQPDLPKLITFLQHMKNTQFLTNKQLAQTCKDIVTCVANGRAPAATMQETMKVVQQFLVHIMNSSESHVSDVVVKTILVKLSEYTSDPQTTARASTSVVLIVLNSQSKLTLRTAKGLVQKAPESARLRASLSCLFSWMCTYTTAPGLGHWITALIQAYEDYERFEILVEVSMDHIAKLFRALEKPNMLHIQVAHVIFHVLASIREWKPALLAIADDLEQILVILATASGTHSRVLLENAVNIVTEMFHAAAPFEGNNKFKYNAIERILERYMSSRDCAYIKLPPWPIEGLCAQPPIEIPAIHKVGLNNIGNSCYMNSILQVLLLTRQFSNHVMIEKSDTAYWSKLGQLFAKMLHSFASRINPGGDIKVFKPRFFSYANQHDSSEFLGYLLELLTTYEDTAEENVDYSKPTDLRASRAKADRALRSSTSQASTPNEAAEPENESPRPGSSQGGQSTSANKRPGRDESSAPSKRFRFMDASFKDKAFVDFMFAGVQVTRIVCGYCGWSSSSYDVFRELQLSFPEQPDDYQYSVQGLLDYYCSTEMLVGDNQYYCHRCSQFSESEKDVHIETPPQYLVIVLKNFKYNQTYTMLSKLTNKVLYNYSVTLPTRAPTTVHSQFELYAAVIHSGSSLHSGHYFALGTDGDAWYKYDDEMVTVSTKEQVNTLHRVSTPYVLFYRRTDVQELAPPQLHELPQKLQDPVVLLNKEFEESSRNVTRSGRP